MKNNVRPIIDARIKKNANETVKMLMTEEFLIFMLDESQKRFTSKKEQRAAIIGGAMALSFYGKEIKRGVISK